MPLLERFINLRLQADSNEKYHRLIDYELLADGDRKRTVGFGYHAGGSRFLPLIILLQRWILLRRSSLVAGVLESLSAMAHSHLENGVASPFLVRFSIPPPSANIYSIVISTHPDLTPFLQMRAYRPLFDPGTAIGNDGNSARAGPFHNWTDGGILISFFFRLRLCLTLHLLSIERLPSS